MIATSFLLSAIFTLLPTPQQDTVEAVGAVVAARTVRVPAPAGIPLVEIVAPGHRAKKGDALARFDDRLARLDVEAERLNLLEQRGELALAATALQSAEHSLFRGKALLAELEEDGTPEEIEDLKYAVFSAQVEVETAKLRREIAEARLRGQELRIERANLLLERTRCLASIDGVVTRVHLQPGEVLPGERGAFASTPVLEIATSDDLLIECMLANRVWATTKVGMRAAIQLREYPGRFFEGKVSEVSPVLDPTRASFGIRVVFESKDLKLVPGMQATVRVHLK